MPRPVTGAIAYRSLAGDWWPAALEAEHPDGRIDIVVDGLQLHRITVFAGTRADCPKGQVWRP